MPIHHIKGDLFDSQDCLAHCVSQDLGMAGGIAYQFKRRFGGVETLRDQHKRVGEAAMLVRNGRAIFYLVTKRRLGDYPTYDALEASLFDMYHQCKMNHIINVAMPKIGCGIDRLDWDRVENIIGRTFRDISVTIYTP